VFPGEKQVDDAVALSVSVSSRKNWPVARVNPSFPPGGDTAAVGVVTFVGVTSAQSTSTLRVGFAKLPLFEATTCAATVYVAFPPGRSVVAVEVFGDTPVVESGLSSVSAWVGAETTLQVYA
jgi:hypothetical protein